jgi:hypothetical protein
MASSFSRSDSCFVSGRDRGFSPRRDAAFFPSLNAGFFSRRNPGFFPRPDAASLPRCNAGHFRSANVTCSWRRAPEFFRHPMSSSPRLVSCFFAYRTSGFLRAGKLSSSPRRDSNLFLSRDDASFPSRDCKGAVLPFQVFHG